MNCNEFKNKINELLDNSDDIPEPLKEHGRNCAQCARQLQQAQGLLMQLKDLPVPSYSSEFKQQALRNAGRLQPKQPIHHRGFVAGFSSAIAATLALWLFSNVFFGYEQDTANNTIQISLLQKQEIKLAFDAPQALHNAKVSITLPSDTQIAGLPGKREISWRTDLKAGSNVLKLPIMALGGQGGELIARVEHQGKTQQLRIMLQIKTPGAAGLDRQPIVAIYSS